MDAFSALNFENSRIVYNERMRRYLELQDENCTTVNKTEELFFINRRIFENCVFEFLNCASENNMVKLKEFGKFIDWFGPYEGIMERVRFSF